MQFMRLKPRTIHVALTTMLMVAACGDDKGGDTTGSTGTTGSQEQTTSTTGTTGPDPTTGPTTGPNPTDGTTGPDPTDGTTGPDPTDGTTGDPSDPAIYDMCKANDADAAMLAEAQCKCLVMSGSFPDQAACLAEFANDPAEAECTCMVYAKHPETKAVLECIAGPQKTFVDCFAMAGCDDPDAQNACFDAYFGVVLDCPEPSDATNMDLGFACYGEKPFMCGSGEQIFESSKCDFQDDCMDGSDEVGCPNVFMCMNGTKIPDDFKCDGQLDCCEGEPECRDMSDEAGCPTFMCGSGETIPEKLKCDGGPDCMDESDEKDCPVFMCGSGEEIPESWKCDEFPDCRDSSDEANCP